jgi:hypothetical protein
MGHPLHCSACACESGFQGKLGWGEPERCCNGTVKAPNPHRLHPTSKSYVYKVFQHLAKLWMDIWVRPYTDMPVQVRGGVLGKLS